MRKAEHILLLVLLGFSLSVKADVENKESIPGIKSKHDKPTPQKNSKNLNQLLEPFSNDYQLNAKEDPSIKTKEDPDAYVHIKEDPDPYNPRHIIGVKKEQKKIMIPSRSRNEYRKMKGLVNREKFSTRDLGRMPERPEELQTYEFKNDTCKFRASYDPKRVDLEILKNSRLLEFTDEFHIKTPVFSEDFLDDPDEARSSIRRLTRECKEKMATLKDLNSFLITPYIEEFRYKTYAMAIETCRAKYYILQSYDSLGILHDYPNAGMCQKYSDALVIGKEYLIKFWKEMELERNPKAKQKKKLRVPPKYELILDVLENGWYGCIQNKIEKPVTDERNTDFLNALENLEYECKKPPKEEEDYDTDYY